jgi:hypothetical protein
MNEFGEPNMGNPSVRFDEGRARVGHWPWAFQPILSRLLYITESQAAPVPQIKNQKFTAALHPKVGTPTLN